MIDGTEKFYGPARVFWGEEFIADVTCNVWAIPPRSKRPE